MNADLWILVGLILSGAGWIVVHLALLIRAARALNLHPAVRALALLPPAAPFVVWVSGSRLPVVVWSLLGIAYLVLRSLG